MSAVASVHVGVKALATSGPLLFPVGMAVQALSLGFVFWQVLRLPREGAGGRPAGFCRNDTDGPALRKRHPASSVRIRRRALVPR
jgi:hypothetical protein